MIFKVYLVYYSALLFDKLTRLVHLAGVDSVSLPCEQTVLNHIRSLDKYVLVSESR